MDEIRKVIHTKVVTNVEFVISGRVYNLFKEWLKTKKISNQKLKLLVMFNKRDKTFSIEEIQKTTNMSIPLISYHINGNINSEGLLDTEMISKKHLNDGGKRIGYHITPFGKEILKVIEEVEDNSDKKN